jgi:hypothetical protein
MYTERSLFSVSKIIFVLTLQDKQPKKANEGDLPLAQVDVHCEVKSFLHAKRTAEMQNWCLINFNDE